MFVSSNPMNNMLPLQSCNKMSIIWKIFTHLLILEWKESRGEHFMLTFTVYLSTVPLTKVRKHTCEHENLESLKRGETGVWFIAHLGWFDQWQSASTKSLPQTELNKQTESIYTVPDNPLIHITCFLINTHTHMHTGVNMYAATPYISGNTRRQACTRGIHTSTHKHLHACTRTSRISDFCLLSSLTSSTGHG